MVNPFHPGHGLGPHLVRHGLRYLANAQHLSLQSGHAPCVVAFREFVAAAFACVAVFQHFLGLVPEAQFAACFLFPLMGA